ncbi:MAG TPA: hypothetical protein DCR10_08835, partial [Acidimicrobiaceae bacterium]|nr:hypothetical protein [Acidimicrobiaceae bacterium]
MGRGPDDGSRGEFGRSSRRARTAVSPGSAGVANYLMAEWSASSIPVVDLADSRGLIDAFATTGFAAVRGHGVQHCELVAMRRLLVALFAVDDAAKRRCAVQPDNYRGFIPLRFFTPNRDNGAPADAFEGYK